jgi:uncharacterized membrane protein YvlD (DUF360 family)
MAALATVFGVVALSLTLSLSCVSMPNLVLKIMSITFLVAGLCLILTLVGFADCDGQCSLAGSGYMAIITSIVYLIVAAIIFKIRGYESDDEIPLATKGAESAKEDITIEVTELPDGSKKTVTTTVDKYGNKTVEEMLEPPPVEQDQDVETEYLPDGSLLTRRTTYDEDGNKVIEETVEKAAPA